MTDYPITDEELIATLAGMRLPTITSEIALQITANKIGCSKHQAKAMGAPKDRLRSHVHERLQKLVEVGSVERLEFHSNDRIHLYTLPQEDTKDTPDRERQEQQAHARANA